MDTAGLTVSTDDHNSKDVNKSVFKDIMANNAETVFKIEAKENSEFCPQFLVNVHLFLH